jgi:mRNA-degrading endonuclease RelE of RelBE toxin-antitoxin system
MNADEGQDRRRAGVVDVQTSEHSGSTDGYRVIYRFDLGRNELLLITLGHRREVYRA